MSVIRIDFVELGPDQYVVMRDPRILPWRVQRELSKAVEADDMDGKLRSAEIVAMSLIKSGRILDWDGKEIEFPLNDETVGDLPGEVITKVVEKFGEMRGVDVEKKS